MGILRVLSSVIAGFHQGRHLFIELKMGTDDAGRRWGGAPVQSWGVELGDGNPSLTVTQA